jgi:hypothetical protein
MVKTKFGYMTCPTPDCGTRLAVRENENGTLSWRCDECEGTGYVRKGEGAYPLWLKKIERTAPAPAPKPAPKTKPDPEPKEKEKPAAAAKTPSCLLG